MNIDVLRRVRDPDPGMAAEVDLEASRWVEIMALVDLLTPDERTAPGYFVNPDWSIKDLVAHLGWWQAEARSELLKIATRMYEPHDFDIDRRNAEIPGRPQEPALGSRLVTSHGRPRVDARSLVRHGRAIDRGQPVGPARPAQSTMASTSIPLWAWTAELIDLRTHPRVDERDP